MEFISKETYMIRRFSTPLFIFAFIISVTLIAEPLTPEQQEKVKKKLEQLKLLGSDETIIKEVKNLTATPPVSGMTNDKWKTLTLISPEVKALTKNTLATYLKTKKDESITEMFVSDSAGNKIAFLSKTSSFCHKGKAKHDSPMSGKTWIGDVEIDESTGMQQVQVSLPVFDGKKPIGSIVVGLSLSKL
jgi:hypothetical protein